MSDMESTFAAIGIAACVFGVAILITHVMVFGITTHCRISAIERKLGIKK